MKDHDTILRYLHFANILFGALSAIVFLLQFSYISISFMIFLRALFGFLLTIPIVYLEYRPILGLFRYASFYYSYLGRGILYIFLSSFVVVEGLLPILVVLILFFGGCIFIGIESSNSFPQPSNFEVEDSVLPTRGDDLI